MSAPPPLPVILAAGLGTRLGRTRPKCLTEVCGTPILERTFRALRSCGLRDAVVVTGFEAAQLEAFARAVAPELALQFVCNPHYGTTGTARSLALGLGAVSSSRAVVIIEADVAFEAAVLADLLEHPAPDAVAVEREQPFHSGSVVTLDPAGVLTCWYHERTRPATLHRDHAWKTANLNRLAAGTWRGTLVPLLHEVEADVGPKAPAEYAYAALVARPDAQVVGVDIGARVWFEIDTPEDLALAERKFAMLGP